MSCKPSTVPVLHIGECCIGGQGWGGGDGDGRGGICGEVGGEGGTRCADDSGGGGSGGGGSGGGGIATATVAV